VERRGEQNFFTSYMIQSCMNKVTAIDLSQEILIGEDIKIKAYYAGHVLGAAMFHVQVGQESVLYTGDYNMTPDRHLGGAIIDRCQPDVLITESTYATVVRDSKRARERDFLKQVHQCVASGGKVLVPTFALGRVQELCTLIDAYWTRAGLSEIPVYFTGGMAEMATKYYKNWINWTNEGIQMASISGASITESGSKQPCNPFDFKNIKPFERAYADLPGPMLVFSTPGMLHSGTSLELFKKWCSDPLNMLIVPGYCVAGTVGAKVLAGQKTIEIQEVRVRGTTMTSTTVNLPVNLQVKNLSFSAHVDAKGILQLISQCRPKNVVLVHGEGGKMKNLKLRIVNTFNCPVYFPANGEVLFIETLPGAAKSIEISRSLWGKRRRDISEGAIEIVENELLDEASKIEMLIESANLQDRLDSIDLSEGILTNCSINSRPLILSAFESSNSPQHIPSFTALKNDVRRFFLRDKLMKINVKSHDFVAILHLFLLK
jgi:integrator complex subunit 11